MKPTRTLQMLLVTTGLALGLACSTSPRTTSPSSTSYSTSSALLAAEDFDLKSVIGLVQKGGFDDMKKLEDEINDKESGINNVDIDGDGVVDTVAVEESRNGEKITLTFTAIPSKDPASKGGWTPVAEITLTPSGEGQVEVEAGYPEYVTGHDSHYYHHHHHHGGFTNGFLWGYLLSSNRPVYYGHPYGYYSGYSRYPARSTSDLSFARARYQTHTPAVKSTSSTLTPKPRPSSYGSVSPRAQTSSHAVSSRSRTSSPSTLSPRSSSSSSKPSSSSSGSVRSSGSSSRSGGGFSGGK